ncbi:MAG: hypothetical protein NZ770_00240, partial [Candidatus Poseidoniaceae archaeon]|nr:hypothetical protein [Candidatus Poseidoniaceae archaeon]
MLDPDEDGWDADRNGAVTSDASPSLIDLELGEQFSNLQEYFTYDDNGNRVRAGLKMVGVDASAGTLFEYPHSSSSEGQGTASIMHPDVVALQLDGTGEQLYAGTRLGISVINLENGGSMDHPLPSGTELSDMLLLELDNEDVLVLATSGGVILAKLDLEGQPVAPTWWTYANNMEVTTLEVLLIDSSTTHVLALGPDGGATIVEVSSTGELDGLLIPSSDLTNPLNDLNATPHSMAHVQFESESPKLYIGTDVGLLVCPSATMRDTFGCMWRFTIFDDDELRIKPQGTAEAADVRDVVPDGPGEQVHV